MGIKFTCPNGHKLHVKSFLSGKRAICPKCGEKVIVPSEDTAGDAVEIGSASIEIAIETGSGSSSMMARPRGEAPVITPAGAPTSSSSGPVTSAPAISPIVTDAAPPAADPIAAAPTAVWYVRPASGGQFGPASGEIMRGWVQDGRVGASSLVWRAGWDEWQSAAEVFPHLKAMLAAPSGPAAVVGGSAEMPSLPTGLAVQHAQPSAPPPAKDGSTSPLPQVLRKRRRRNEVSLMASGVLLAIALILVIVLAIVFRSQLSPAEPQPAAESTAEP